MRQALCVSDLSQTIIIKIEKNKFLEFLRILEQTFDDAITTRKRKMATFSGIGNDILDIGTKKWEQNNKHAYMPDDFTQSLAGSHFMLPSVDKVC